MQTEIYSALADIYDEFMSEIPYEKWAGFIKNLLYEHGIRDGLILDLGCGSGTLTNLLSDMGYDMIGVDGSCEMLNYAKEKQGERDILYLNQDIREFELYGTVRAIVSTCDTLNYVTAPEEIKKVFKLVNNYLDPDGLFIFDLHTEYYYREILSDNVFAATDEDCAYIWENRYDMDERINEYNVTIFKRMTEDESLYERNEEIHTERAYSVVDIKQYLNEAGLRLLSVYDGYKSSPLDPFSDRAVFVSKKLT